eukprot:4046174-Alexandrium_andersonii.AAC.1
MDFRPFDPEAEEPEDNPGEIMLDPRLHEENLALVRFVSAAPVPEEPSAQEKARREVSRIPYQSWCPTCAAAMARGGYH